MSKANLKITEYENSLINEISAISTFKPITVRNTLESAFLRQLESALSGEDIQIPFIGTLHVEYLGDEFVSGSKVANIKCTVEPSELFIRLMGEIHDGDSSTIWQISERKIRASLQSKLDE